MSVIKEKGSLENDHKQETKEIQQLNEWGVLDGLMEQKEGTSGKTGDFQIKSPDFS